MCSVCFATVVKCGMARARVSALNWIIWPRSPLVASARVAECSCIMTTECTAAGPGGDAGWQTRVLQSSHQISYFCSKANRYLFVIVIFLSTDRYVKFMYTIRDFPWRDVHKSKLTNCSRIARHRLKISRNQHLTAAEISWDQLRSASGRRSNNLCLQHRTAHQPSRAAAASRAF